MTLKARWKERPKTEATEQTMATTEMKTESVKPSTTEKAMPDWEYSKRKKTDSSSSKTAKTGDETDIFYYLIALGASLSSIIIAKKKLL